MSDIRQEPTFSRSSAAPAAPRRRPRSAAPVAAAVIALAAAAGAWFWLSQTQAPQAPEPPVAQPAPAAPAKASAPELVPSPADQVLNAEDVAGALERLLGRDAVLKFLDATDFPRKAVATLDNLGRDHAPVQAWPVLPAPGRFLVAGGGTPQTIAAENALRYLPFVAFIDSVDPAQAVDLYRRMYPVLQKEYRALGLGERPLHARVLEVIDILLKTPEPAQSPAVTLTEVKGPMAPAQPWTRYEYADPSLQRLTSGQKMLLRVGPEHRKVLKAKLQAIRRELLQASVEPSRP